MSVSPPRPWRIVETRPGDLLTLRLGKGGSGPTLSLAAIDHVSDADLPAWCRERWSALHARKWRAARGDSESEALARAAEEWSRYGFEMSSAESAPIAGVLGGLSVSVRSPRRTEAYQWRTFTVGGHRRALELETEASRLASDQREVSALLASVEVKGPG